MPPGQIVSIIGPNGAGKTTLFNLITGLEPADEGQVFFESREITRLPVHRRITCGLGRSFQNLRLFKNLNLLENVMVGAYRLGRSSFVGSLLGFDARERRAMVHRAEAALREVGVVEQRFRFPSQVSHLERRLVELARALVGEPKVLLLDEPTAGTTRSESVHMGDLIRRLKEEKGLTVVLVEHNMLVVMRYSDFVIVLNNGQKIAEDTPEKVQRHSEVIRAYLGEGAGQPENLATGRRAPDAHQPSHPARAGHRA